MSRLHGKHLDSVFGFLYGRSATAAPDGQRHDINSRHREGRRGDLGLGGCNLSKGCEPTEAAAVTLLSVRTWMLLRIVLPRGTAYCPSAPGMPVRGSE